MYAVRGGIRAAAAQMHAIRGGIRAAAAQMHAIRRGIRAAVAQMHAILEAAEWAGGAREAGLPVSYNRVPNSREQRNNRVYQITVSNEITVSNGITVFRH